MLCSPSIAYCFPVTYAEFIGQCGVSRRYFHRFFFHYILSLLIGNCWVSGYIYFFLLIFAPLYTFFFKSWTLFCSRVTKDYATRLFKILVFAPHVKSLRSGGRLLQDFVINHTIHFLWIFCQYSKGSSVFHTKLNFNQEEIQYAFTLSSFQNQISAL